MERYRKAAAGQPAGQKEMLLAAKEDRKKEVLRSARDKKIATLAKNARVHTRGTCGSDFRNNRTLVFESGTGHKRAGYPSDLLNRVNRCPEMPTVIDRACETSRAAILKIINQQSSWEVCHALTK